MLVFMNYFNEPNMKWQKQVKENNTKPALPAADRR